MNIKSRFAESLRAWRRRTFPPSVADVEWRHEFLAERLLQIENTVTNQLVASGFAAPAAVQSDILAVLRFLEPQRVRGFKKIRLGNAHDGGYVQLGDFEGISRAFSFGIRDDDSWDLAMATAGVPVEQFDHSVAAAPSRHPLLTFHRKEISVAASNRTATLPDLVAKYSSQEKADLVLKMDIEGCEWDVLDQADLATLRSFAQIICEFHSLSHLAELEFRTRAKRVFEKLRADFRPIHLHANNCGKIYVVANVPVPDTLEVSFARCGRYDFADTDERFPTPLDAPNNPSLPDIVLGAFRF